MATTTPTTPTTAPAPLGEALSPALVEAELARITASRGFRNSTRHIRFLRHLVKATLAGDMAALREITLALEIFTRSPARFDPRRDTIVRVEARRLRQRLAAYYAEEGQHARLEFVLPARGYQLEIKHRDRIAGAERRRSSVAVFDLVRLGSDDVLAPLALALSAELIGALSRLNGLRVVAAGAAPAGPSVADLRRAAKGLNVGSLVVGTLAVQAELLHIDLRLVRAEDGTLMWSRRAQLTAHAALDGLEPLARGIIAALYRDAALRQLERITLSGSRPLLPGLATGGPTPEALERLSLARVAMRTNTVEGYRKAAAWAEEIALREPTYGPAFVALSQALLHLVGFTVLPSEPTVQAARVAAQRALELDPNLADAHSQLAVIQLVFDRDWPRAEASHLAAVHYAPAQASSHATYGWALMMNRRFADARSAYAEARDLDPLSLLYRSHEALISLYEHDWQRAEQGLDAVLEVEPNHLLATALKAALLLYAGRFDEGQQAYLHIAQQFPKLSLGHCGLAQAHALLGNRAEAERELALLRATFDAAYASPYQIAMAYTRLGEPEQALHWLAESARLHDFNFVCVGVDPAFDSLRGRADFCALLADSGLGHLARPFVAA